MVRDFVSGTDRIGIDHTGFGLGLMGNLPAALIETGPAGELLSAGVSGAPASPIIL